MKAPVKVSKPGVNYYSLLGVPSTASQEEITRAFRKRILQVHLDKMGPEDDAEVCYLTIEAHRILSDKALRAKYDVERSSSKDYKNQQEEFLPAGYICYDVGNSQMSRQLLDSITSWTSEYDSCAVELSDNYFHCFSQIMTQVGCDGDNPGPKEQQDHHHCSVCDKKFITEAHHWDSVINPYRAMFFSDRVGIGALTSYFEGLIGTKLFNWEMRYLPSRLLGIWGSSEWSILKKLQQDALNTLKKCDVQNDPHQPSCSSSISGPLTLSPSNSKELISKLETFRNALTSKNNNESFISAQNRFLKGSLLENLIWVLQKRDETAEPLMNKMSELLMQDDLQQIVCLGVAMKNILGFQSGDWELLIQDALTQEQFELAMLWTMLAVEMGDKCKGDWFQLGMTIREMGDAVLAHFCFLLSGCDSSDAYEELADIFTENGAHIAAVEYHLNRGNLFQLLNKSRAFKRVDPEASKIYGGIFNSMRIKGLLQQLKKRSTQCSSETNDGYNAEIEELIEIIQDLEGNLLEGFRIIVSTWPDVFEEGPGHWIHRATIQFLRRGRVNLKSQKLILAAAHYLPEEERQEEIGVVAKESSQLTKSMLERAQETNDFEMLTDVLIHLNKRTLATAEEYLVEIAPPPPTPILPPTDSNCKGCDDESREDDDDNDKEERKVQEDTELKRDKDPQPEPPSEPEQTQQPPPPPPGHKSAIMLLLSGTIHKVKEAWLDAMKDYQNALLSAPEVLHRVLPCVSKLVQDIQFHEAVVSQVNQEIQSLQDQLRKREYPDIDEFSSDKRRSLILTDVAPKMDYGYKDSVAKIQPDPDKIPAPPPPDEDMPDAPPPPPANTPMVTLDKNQEAIQTGQQDGQIDHLTAALSYVDLLKALPLQMHPGPIVMAASHFLRAMDDNASSQELGKLYAYRNAIMLMAENLLRVDKKLQHTIHHGLTHKHMLSILLSAHEKLSKGLQAAKKETCKNDGDADDNDEEQEDGAHCENSPPTSGSDGDDDIDKANNNKGKASDASSRNRKDLIRKSDAHVISKFFQNVVNFPKVEPLASIPTLNCSDLVYVETLGNSFLSQFCADKVRQKHQSPLIPKHLHAYTHFVEVWKGRSTLSDFPQTRVKAMEELVALKGWTMGDIQRKMTWPFLTLSDGFSPPMQCLLKLRDPITSYRTIEGFHIDYETGTVDLLMGRDTLNPVDTLFDLHDIRDVVSLTKAGLDRLVFSFETPDGGGMSSHPFKEGKITLTGSGSGGLGKLIGQQQQQKIWAQIPEYVQATLSRATMLLCYLASGLELSSDSPFWMRRTDDGLLYRLDDHLQHFARPIPWRKAERRRQDEKFPGLETETMGKFWLNMIEVFEEIDEEEEECEDPQSILPIRQLTYRVGQVRTEVRPNTLVMTLDPKRNKPKLSPEAEFARDLTKHFTEFSRAFPELQRLEELVKLCIVCSKLRQVLTENKALIHEFHLKNNSSDLATTCGKDNKNLKGLSKVCSLIENFLSLQNPEGKVEASRQSCCNWFPATFCHNMDPDVYDVTAGIELDPVVTYGPVPSHPKPISVPLQRVINLYEMGQDETLNDEESICSDLETGNPSDSEVLDEGEIVSAEEEEEEEEEENEEEDDDESEEDDEEVGQVDLKVDNPSSDEALSIVPEVEEERCRSVVSTSSKSLPEEEFLEGEEQDNSIECDADIDDHVDNEDCSNSSSASAEALAEVDQDLNHTTDDEFEDAEEVSDLSQEDAAESDGDNEEEKAGSEISSDLIEIIEEEEAEVPTLTIKFRRLSVALTQSDEEISEKETDAQDEGFEANKLPDENANSDKESEKDEEDEQSEYEDNEEENDNEIEMNTVDDQRAYSDDGESGRNEQSEPQIAAGASFEEGESCSEEDDDGGNEQVEIEEADESCAELSVESGENSPKENGVVRSDNVDESGSESDDIEEEIEINNGTSHSPEENKETSSGNETFNPGRRRMRNQDELEDIKNSALQLNLNGIEGKSIMKLRKSEDNSTESCDQALTKRAFLSRRSKVLATIANAKRRANVGDKDNCSDDGDSERLLIDK